MKHATLVRPSRLLLALLVVAGGAAAQSSVSSRVAKSPHTAAGPVHAYAITPLGGEATAINDAGQVMVNTGTLAALFTPSQPNGTEGELVPLGTLGGTVSIGKGLNASGHGTGFSTLAGGAYRAFLSGDGPLQSLGTLSGDFSSGTGINDVGQIVGFAYGSESEEHGFLWTPFVRGGSTGSMLDLGTLGGEYSEALAVNQAGDVAGFAYTPAGAFHAFRWHAGHMADLGTLGGSYSKAFALDDQGRIVGQAYLPGNTKAHACLWANGQPAVDLGNLC
jgi:probable HAF family extracellular repeat protein